VEEDEKFIPTAAKAKCREVLPGSHKTLKTLSVK